MNFHVVDLQVRMGDKSVGEVWALDAPYPRGVDFYLLHSVSLRAENLVANLHVTLAITERRLTFPLAYSDCDA